MFRRGFPYYTIFAWSFLHFVQYRIGSFRKYENVTMEFILYSFIYTVLFICVLGQGNAGAVDIPFIAQTSTVDNVW